MCLQALIASCLVSAQLVRSRLQPSSEYAKLFNAIGRRTCHAKATYLVYHLTTLTRQVEPNAAAHCVSITVECCVCNTFWSYRADGAYVGETLLFDDRTCTCLR